MSRWSRLLHDATHSRRFLWRLALGTLTLGLALGYAWHRWHPAPPPDLDARIMAALASGVARGPGLPALVDPSTLVLDALEQDLAAAPRRFDEVLDLLPRLTQWAPALRPAAVTGVLVRHFTPEQSQLGAGLLEALRGDDAALGRLRAGAAASPPLRYAAHAAGLAYLDRGDLRTAHAWFAREGREPEAVLSRQRAIDCLIAAEDFERLRHLESDPAYAALIDTVVRLQAAIHAKDWPAILALVPRSQFTDIDPPITALALVAGLAWAFFLLQLGQITRLERGAGILCLLALAAGVASTTPTIYAVIWQDDFLGFSKQGDAIETVLYCIGGIGLREEICKLALFLPFIPILLRRGDELEALLVASFVGLGFAMEENGNYFLSSDGTAVAGRFLTANFFHIALTGMSGLALFRACARGWGGLQEFLTVFGAAIVAHGAYNALLMLPGFEFGGYLALAVFVLTCQYYFGRAHALRESFRATISLSGAFVAGVATVGAAMIVFQVVRLGPADGLMVVAPEMVGTIVLLVMFFREFNEPLAA